MGGRYTLYNTSKFADTFHTPVPEGFFPNYNAAPSQMLPIVTAHSPIVAYMARWGLIPSWSKEFRVQFATINARSDRLLSSRLYKPLLRSKRCLVPANAFYEFTNEVEGKQPHLIRHQQNTLMAFAGLYDIWKDAEDTPRYSYTIITKPANSFMGSIHDRMPVILDEETQLQWINHAITDFDQIMDMLRPIDDGRLRAYKVNRELNNVRNNSKALIKPE